MQRLLFRLRGRKPERVAYEFWKSIKKEMPYPVVLEEVLAAGEDVTQQVKELEKQELLNVMNDDLPFTGTGLRNKAFSAFLRFTKPSSVRPLALQYIGSALAI
jgi:hypothetical protein